MRRHPLPPSRFALVSLAILAVAPTSLAQTPFLAGLEFDLGASGLDAEAGDMDGDGLPDLVVAASGAQLEVFLADGAGSLAPPVIYIQSSVQSVSLADLDADGDLDVVTAFGFAGPNVGLWTGGPGGALTLAGDLTAAGITREVEAADFDLDGVVDVAVRSEGVPAIQLALGQGVPSFAPFTQVGVYTETVAMEAADVTGDGLTDLVVGDDPGVVQILRGAPVSGLIAGATLASCGKPRALELADLTGDGLLDIGVGCAPGAPFALPAGSAVEIHVADGLGGFALQGSVPLAPYPTGLASADLDGDGDADLAVATEFDYTVLLGTGTGFTPLGSWAAGKCDDFGCDWPVDVELVDVDLNGVPDLVGLDGALRVLPGAGNGELVGARLWRYAPVATPLIAGPRDLAALDLGGDGPPEIAIGQDAAGLALLGADGAGGLLPAVAAPGASGLLALHTVQLDGDGVADLLSVGTQPAGVHAQLGDGQGGLGSPATLALPGQPFHTAAGDVDGDGHADLAVAAAGELRVVRSNGAGGLAGELALPFTNPGPEVVGLADLDLDGDLDLVGMGFREVSYPFSAVYWDPTHRIFLGDGAGGFTLAAVDHGFNLAPDDLVLADVDVDGLSDMIAVGTYLDGSYYSDPLPTLHTFAGDGQGGFSNFASVDTPTAGNTDYLWVADLTGDGRPDVLTGGPSQVDFFRGMAGEDLAAPVAVHTGMDGGDGVLVDLDGDGWLDLARANTAFTNGLLEASVTVLRNAGADLPGSMPFGVGTPGCAGALGLSATVAPSVGEQAFALTGSGVAPGSAGFGFLAPGADFPGSDPFGLGLTLHLDLTAGGLVPFAFAGTAGGSAHAPLPVPASPGLVNQVLYAQSVWLQPADQACGGALLNLASSRGLRIVIQP